MFFSYFIIEPVKRFFNREDNQFYTSVFIRTFALGLIIIFEPIYVYLHLKESIFQVLIFFALIHGLYSFLAVFGGKIMARLGHDWTILISHLFFLAYYIFLYTINVSFYMIPLAIIFRAIGMALFWPSYHISFARFSKQNQRGKYVGKKFYAITVPNIFGPVLGGVILSYYNYHILFIIVSIFLIISAIPLFFTKREKETYEDNHQQAWARVFQKDNQKYSLGFICESLEGNSNEYLWPLFMFIIGIKYLSIGELTSFAIFLSLIAIFLAGRITDTKNRLGLLKKGSLLTSFSWILKIFINNPVSAFFIHNFYMIARYFALVPFQALFYEKAVSQESLADEFLIMREIIGNFARFIMLFIFAGIFYYFPDIRISFFITAIISLGFISITKPLAFKNK